MTTSVLVVGTGSLSQALCHALAGLAGTALEVTVAGRREEAVTGLCHTAGVTAGLARRPVRFAPLVVDLDTPQGAARLLRDAEPAGVVMCASRQSPWESRSRPSAWTDLLAQAGFGLTLPLQADLVLSLATELVAGDTGAWLVNACFPDVVNPVLATLGVPALSGIGNVGTLAAALQHALGLPDQTRIRMIAHHAHLHRPPATQDGGDGASEALAWLDDAPLAAVGGLLAAQRAVDRQRANQITGSSAAHLVDALTCGTTLATHLPGPLGLPGGYPVLLADGRLRLRLPPGFSPADAIAHNQRAAVQDGVSVVGTAAVLAAPARAALSPHLPRRAGGYPLVDLPDVCRELLELRDRLRRAPAATRPAGSATAQLEGNP